MERRIHLECVYCHKRLGNVINTCYFVNMKKSFIICVKNAIPAKKIDPVGLGGEVFEELGFYQ